MYVKKAFANQFGRAGIEYKINKLRGENILFNGHNLLVMAGILGPDS